MVRQYLQLPRAVHVLCLGTFINRAGTLLLPFLTLYLTTERGLSIEFATLAMGALGAGSLVGSLVGGHLADLIGRRTVMVISLLGGAVVLRFFGSLSAPWAILAAVVAFSIFADMYRPAASAMIADLVAPEQRPHAYGLMYVAINLGFSVGASLGGIVATYWFVWLFWLDALTAAVYAVILLLLIRETLPSRRNPLTTGSDGQAVAPGSRDETLGADQTSAAEAVKHILRDRTYLVFCAGSLALGLVYVQAMSTFPIYLDRLGIGTAAYGRIIALNGLLICLFQLPLTVLLNRFNRATVLICSAVMVGLGFGLKVFAISFWHFAVTVVVWTAGEMMMAAYMQAIVADLAPARLRARYMGVFSMCYSSANMFGAPIGGRVLDVFGGTYLWGGSFVLTLLSAVLYLSIHRQMAPKAHSDSD